MAVAASLLGATLVLVRSRQLSIFLDEGLVLVSYAAGLLLGVLALVLLGRLWRKQRRIRFTVALVVMLILGVGIMVSALGLDIVGFGESSQVWLGALVGACLLGLLISLAIGTLGSALLHRRPANVINLITSISAFGLGIGAAAVILVLSVFNGFEEVIGAMFGKFNPAVKVMPARGKTFPVDSIPLADIRAFPGVAQVSLTLEETAFFEYGDSRAFGKLKGVDSVYAEVSLLDSTLIEGEFAMRGGNRTLGVIGLGLRNKLNVNTGDAFEPVQVYAAKREQRGPLDRPFRVRSVYPIGTFAIQQEYDQQYLFTDIALVRALLDQPRAASALELSVIPGAEPAAVADALSEMLGERYLVLDRMEQDADLMRLMNIEKWLSYLILTLVLLLVSFNLVGGLWLIVLEKEHDIAILQTMGAPKAQIRGIFLGVGMLLSVLGVLIGLGLALLVYWLQVNYDLVTVPQGLVVSAYPIDMRVVDVVVVLLTVLGIGFLASLPAVRRAVRVTQPPSP